MSGEGYMGELASMIPGIFEGSERKSIKRAYIDLMVAKTDVMFHTAQCEVCQEYAPRVIVNGICREGDDLRVRLETAREVFRGVA